MGTMSFVGQDGDNVLLDDDNAIRFIDPIIGFKQSLVSCFPDVMKSDDSVEDMVEKICGVYNAAGVSSWGAVRTQSGH